MCWSAWGGVGVPGRGCIGVPGRGWGWSAWGGVEAPGLGLEYMREINETDAPVDEARVRLGRCIKMA